jgi:cytosine/adenosine deaminase-related metal-dependent hydrolase
MRQVLANAVILVGKDLEVTKGYLVMKDDIIEKISEGSPPGRAVDLKHGFIIPAFVNAHTHVMDSIAKELYVGKTQPEVVGPGGIKFKELNSADTRSLVSAAQATLYEMYKSGTLAHCDFREGGVAGVRLLRRCSRVQLKSVILGRPPSFTELPDVLKEADGLGLPSLDFMRAGELEKAARLTRKVKKLLALHVAETDDAQKASVKKTGMTEVKRALELKPSFVVHATHATKDDLRLLQKKRVPVVFCPRANSLLGAGVPPVAQAMQLGLKFCLGTDNAMVCQPDMFEELRFAWACLRRSDPSAGSDEARELMTAATLRSARLLRLPWGPIEVGKKVAFTILSRGKNLENIRDIHAGIVNRARAENVRTVFSSAQGNN